MKKMVNLFEALGDETKFRIIEFLLDGEKCVCEIFPYTQTKQSNVSIQLKKLVNVGILDFRKEGKKVFYRVVDYRVCDIFKLLNYAEKKVCNNNCCQH